MDIRYRLYPYPVLAADTDDYMQSSYYFTVEQSETINALRLTFDLHLDNVELARLIEQGRAEFVIHLECARTSYRDIICTRDVRFSRELPHRMLSGRLAVCAFIVAARDLSDYTSRDFNSDYAGISFAIERGSILAIGGQYNLIIEKEVEEFAKIPSIFTICKYATDTDELMKIDIDGDKIVVSLAEKCFQDYKVLINIPRYLPTFHAMVVLPALVYLFETLRAQGVEEYEDRRWFRAIDKKLRRFGQSLDDATLGDVPSYELAQRLLDYPVSRGLTAITALDDTEEDDE